MNNRYYVVSVTITSQGTEQRNFTAYDNKDNALRKFYEAFASVGAGPQKISALLLDSNLYPIKSDNWEKELEPTPEPEETEAEE